MKACLSWFAGTKNLPKRGTLLSPVWAALLGQRLPNEFGRDRLSGLIRYCIGAKADRAQPVSMRRRLDEYMKLPGAD